MYQKKRKRTKKAISLITAIAMLSSASWPTTAAASVRLNSQPVMSEESEPGTAGSPAVIGDGSEPDAAGSPAVIGDGSEPDAAGSPAVVKPSKTVTSPAAIDAAEPDNGSNEVKIEPAQLPDSSTASEKTGELSYQEVYSKMAALKETYPEGMTWTNFEPYGSKGSSPEYRWKGGNILGNVSSGVGCAAFAFILSDAAFGNLPAREVYDVKYDNVKPGDILRINNNSHSVIVLQKTAAGVIVAEGNYNKTVHWGRALSKAEVENANFIVTRYPENYDSSGSDAVETEIKKGTDGSLTWTLTDRGTLTISGSGAMRNFSESGDRPAWEEEKDRIHTVVIEDGVTSIGDNAFYHKEQGLNILSVSIPGSVVRIGKQAFKNCQNLLSATISEGVETIGESAFNACAALQYIDFPASITAIGEAAFRQCTKIVRVRFVPGSGKVSIGDSIFEGCSNLTKVVLPEKAECISGGMFAGCSMLFELYIPAGITAIKATNESGGGPFCQTLKVLNFGGSEARWNELQGPTALTRSGCPNLIPNFEVPFSNPFAQDPDDPGDNMGSHVHSWASAEWNHDSSYHWHECSAESCPITDNKEKDGYAEHSYGSWTIDVNAASSQTRSRHRDCTVCAYRQTESIPAAGSSGGSGSSWGSGSSGGSWGSGSSGRPEVPDTADSSDGKDSSSSGTDNSTGSNTSGSPSGDAAGSGDTDIDSPDDSSSSNSRQKELKAQFKKQLKAGLKQQLKAQLKKQLKAECKLNAKSKPKSKSKIKKQIKAELKPLLREKLKKQLRKQYGEAFGKEFIDLFHLQFNAQFQKLYSQQFNLQYKLLASQKKVSK